MSKQSDTKEGGFGKSETEELFFYRVIKKDGNFDAEMARASSWEVRAMQMWGSSANTPSFHAGRPDTPNDDLWILPVNETADAITPLFNWGNELQDKLCNMFSPYHNAYLAHGPSLT